MQEEKQIEDSRRANQWAHAPVLPYLFILVIYGGGTLLLTAKVIIKEGWKGFNSQYWFVAGWGIFAVIFSTWILLTIRRAKKYNEKR